MSRLVLIQFESDELQHTFLTSLPVHKDGGQAGRGSCCVKRRLPFWCVHCGSAVHSPRPPLLRLRLRWLSLTASLRKPSPTSKFPAFPLPWFKTEKSSMRKASGIATSRKNFPSLPTHFSPSARFPNPLPRLYLPP